MDIEQFKNSLKDCLIEIKLGGNDYWAFVPAPLPPDLRMDLELARVLSDADRALGELSGVGRSMANPHLLIGPFIRREAVLSSRIEGTQADIRDLYAYEAGQLALFPGLESQPSEADIKEVLNYVRATEYGLERVKTLPVSHRLIRELHQRLMEGVRGGKSTPGRFRQSQNWLGPPGCTLKEATYVPPPVPQMNKALDAFEKYLHVKDSYPPLMRLAFIHYQFEAIHPFLDGNGRIGRLLISLLMAHWSLLPLPLLYLSDYFERHGADYYSLLLGVSQRGAWPEWISFFLRGVREQAFASIEKVKQLQDLQEEWRKRLTQVRASTLTLQLADSLFKAPLTTIPSAQKIMGVTYRAAQNNVNRLVRAGILEQLGQSSYGKTYAANEIVKIIMGGTR